MDSQIIFQKHPAEYWMNQNEIREKLQLLEARWMDYTDLSENHDLWDIVVLLILGNLINLRYDVGDIGNLRKFLLNELPFGAYKENEWWTEYFKLNRIKGALLRTIIDETRLYLVLSNRVETDEDFVFCDDVMLAEIIARKSPFDSLLFFESDAFVTIDIARIIERTLPGMSLNQKSIFTEIISNLIDEDVDNISLDLKREIIERDVILKTTEDIREMRSRHPHWKTELTDYEWKLKKIKYTYKTKLKKMK